jgi:hypothetical protein
LNIFVFGFPTVWPMIALCRRPVTTVSHWRCQEGFCAKGLAERREATQRGPKGKHAGKLSENGNTEIHVHRHSCRHLQGTSWTGRANIRIRSVEAAANIL